MSGPGREPRGTPTGGRFTPAPRDDPDVDLSDPEDRRSKRLGETLEEVRLCLDDAERLVSLGKQDFDDGWMARRAAKNIVTEFAETTNRLPESFKRAHPDVPWRKIAGMRNRIVHVYENSDPEIVWNVLATDLPRIRSLLAMDTDE